MVMEMVIMTMMVTMMVIMMMRRMVMRMGMFSWAGGARTMGELWRRCLGRPSSAFAGYLRMSLLDNIIRAREHIALYF